MLGTPVDYDKKLKDELPRFRPNLDFGIKKYLDFIPGKNVLDLELARV